MKAYVKPELFYERYELSQHIANCEIEVKEHGDINSCYAVADPDLYLEAFRYFINNENVTCEVTLEDYCVTNGGENQLNVFIS